MPELFPIHPGEILAEEFLSPLGLSQYRLAIDLGVPPRRINEIVLGRRGISADTALRLAHYFGNTGQFWMNLQTRFDLETGQDRIGSALAKAPRLAQASPSVAEGKPRYAPSRAPSRKRKSKTR